jgi:hypothetical protein
MSDIEQENIKLLKKVEMYEGFLHDIQMYAEVSMSASKMESLIGNACSWSYAHRVGNGIYSDSDQQLKVDNAFNRLRDVE